MQHTSQQRPGQPVGVMELLGWGASCIPGLVIVVFAALTLLTPVLLSFTEWNMIEAPTFIGLENYDKMSQDVIFSMALGNSLVDLLLIGAGGFLLCVLIALLLRGLPQGLRYVPIAALFVPLVCPGVWTQCGQLFTGDKYGLVNATLMSWGLIGEPILFWSTPEFVAPFVRIVQLWRSLGPGVLIISAGLDSVRPAVLRESRQRGMTSHASAFWQITLPRMRVPLMLAAATMVMAAMGTATVSSTLVGSQSVGYSAHTLWLHIWDHAFTRFNLGYAAACLSVTNLIEVLAMLLLCGPIFLLTWRPSRAAYAKFPAPAEQTGLTDQWDGWRILWAAVGAVTTLLICVLPAFMLFIEISMSFKPLDELFQFPPRILASEPTLANYADLFTASGSSYVSPWGRFPMALLYVAIPLLLTTALAGLIGWGLSCRRSRLVRVLLAALLLLLVLCSPMANILYSFSGYGYNQRIEFVEVLIWLCWVFVPVSAAMGLSVGEMRRRKWPVLRLLAAAAGYVSLILLLCWLQTIGNTVSQLAAGGLARAGLASAGAVFGDMAGLLLNVPIVAGLFQMLTGIGDTYPLYRGGNE